MGKVNLAPKTEDQNYTHQLQRIFVMHIFDEEYNMCALLLSNKHSKPKDESVVAPILKRESGIFVMEFREMVDLPKIKQIR